MVGEVSNKMTTGENDIVESISIGPEKLKACLEELHREVKAGAGREVATVVCLH